MALLLRLTNKNASFVRIRKGGGGLQFATDMLSSSDANVSS